VFWFILSSANNDEQYLESYNINQHVFSSLVDEALITILEISPKHSEKGSYDCTKT